MGRSNWLANWGSDRVEQQPEMEGRRANGPSPAPLQYLLSICPRCARTGRQVALVFGPTRPNLAASVRAAQAGLGHKRATSVMRKSAKFKGPLPLFPFTLLKQNCICSDVLRMSLPLFQNCWLVCALKYGMAKADYVFFFFFLPQCFIFPFWTQKTVSAFI